jgi:two-component system, NtrC family, nitrogen regulation response regulator NtrX
LSGKILVVDDEPNIGRSIALILGGEGIAVTTVASGEAALTKLAREKVDAIFLDVNLPGIDGLQVLRTLREKGDDVPVIMISGHATIERAVEATRLGALDFVEKPFSRDRVLLLARNALEFQRLRRENLRLKHDPLAAILGESPAVVKLRQTIAEVGPTEVRVLILGESGTGKELVARALHELSPRAGGPFVKLNCAAIPDDLIEAELFGAVKGAYTGAVVAREGRFAAADGGTLLLDEIGDMSLAAQAKVLRVLQEGEFEPVGSTKSQKVDVRVVAATHQDLRQAAQEGRFREDLLYRLNVIPIEMPPLRGRPGDVALLLGHFLRHHAAEHGLTEPRLEAEALARLTAHAWPGNVRELMNLSERLVVLRHGREVTAADLPGEIAVAGGDGATAYAHLPLRDAKLALEADLVRMALERHRGNVTRAARDLGLERTHLHKRIRALGLSADDGEED